MPHQKPYKKTDKLISAGLLLLVLVSAAFLLFSRSDGLEAVVTVGEREVLILSLAPGGEPQTISLEQYGVHITLELSEEGVRVAQSDCPDHICVNTGFISREYQSAVCMPNKTAVSIRKRS